MTRILVVDDKEENLYYLRALLGSSGFAVDEARHGAEALIIARSRRPDLVVSDLLMPVMDGYTLLRYWKSDASLREVPFVVYTATYTEDKDAQLALDLGADAFILKPAEPEALLARVREVLAVGASGVPTRVPEGDPSAMMQVYSETLIRKLEEKSLQLEDANRSLARTANLLQMASRVARIGAWWYERPSGRIVWSDELSRIHGEPAGFSPDLETALSFYDDESRPVISEAVERCFRDGTPYDLELGVRTRAGRALRVRVFGEAASDDEGGFTRIQGALQDITEAHRADEDRRALAERLQQTLESISDAVLMLDRDWRVTYLNPEGERLLRVRRADLVGKVVWDVFTEAKGSQFQQQYEKAIATRQSVHFEEYFAPLATWFEITAYPTAYGLAVYFRDVTQQRATVRRIAQLAALLDKAQDAIIVQNFDDAIIFWNKSAERLYGWTAEEAMGRNAHDLINDRSGEWLEARAELLARGEWFGTLRQVTRDGRRVIVECRWTLVRDAGGEPESILAINTDITERRSLELQFLRAQRLESIGTLAGGIAHDLNNILAPVMMSLELLRELSGEEGADLVDGLQQNVKRGADLVRQVLTFARGLDGKHQPVDVRRIVRELETVARDTFPKRIHVEADVASEACVALGDATQIHQVLMNLAVNARDAMPDGGTLRFAVGRRDIPEGEAARLGINAGPYVTMSVADEGVGIPPEQQEVIFEPFFTTKGVGHGTGLGLSTVQSIIKGLGGTIKLDSAVGRGTTFTCYLPEVAESTEHSSAPVPQRRLPGGDGELVLVVDDEPAIRAVAERILTRYGYRVIVATDGSDALRQYDAHVADIAAIITDVSMPGMDGPALIEALRARHVRVPIIVSSGFIPDEPAGRLLTSDTEFFVSKPFTAETLLTSLRGALVGHG